MSVSSDEGQSSAVAKIKEHWKDQFRFSKKTLLRDTEPEILVALKHTSESYDKYKKRWNQYRYYDTEKWQELGAVWDAISETGLLHSICRLLSPTHGVTKNIQAAACETLSTLSWKSNANMEAAHVEQWYLRKQSMIGLQPFEMNDSQYTTLLLLSYILNITESDLKNLFRIHNESNDHLRLLSESIKLIWTLSNGNNATQNKIHQLSIVSNILMIFRVVYPFSLLSSKPEILNLTVLEASSNRELRLKHSKISFANFIIIHCIGALTALLKNTEIRRNFVTSSNSGGGDSNTTNMNANTNSSNDNNNNSNNDESMEDASNLYLILQCLHHSCVEIKCMAIQFVNTVCVEYSHFLKVFLTGFPVLYLNDESFNSKTESSKSNFKKRLNSRNEEEEDEDEGEDDEESDNDIDENPMIDGISVLLQILQEIIQNGLKKCRYKARKEEAEEAEAGSPSKGEESKKDGEKIAIKSGKKEIDDDIDDNENENENSEKKVNISKNVISTTELSLDPMQFYCAKYQPLLGDCLDCLGTLCETNFQAQYLFVENDGPRTLLKLIVIFDVIENYITKLGAIKDVSSNNSHTNDNNDNNNNNKDQRSSSAASNVSGASALSGKVLYYASDSSTASINSHNSNCNNYNSNSLPKHKQKQKHLWTFHRDYVASLFAIIAGFLLQPNEIWKTTNRRVYVNMDGKNKRIKYSDHESLTKKIVKKLVGHVNIEIENSMKKIDNLLIPFLVKHLIFRVCSKQSMYLLIGSLSCISIVCQSGIGEMNIFKVLTAMEDVNNHDDNNNNNDNDNKRDCSSFSNCFRLLFQDPCAQYGNQRRMSFVWHTHLVSALTEIINCIEYDKSWFDQHQKELQLQQQEQQAQQAQKEEKEEKQNESKKEDGDTAVTTTTTVTSEKKNDNVNNDNDTEMIEKRKEIESSEKSKNNKNVNDMYAKKRQERHDRKSKFKEILSTGSIIPYLSAWVTRDSEDLKKAFGDFEDNALIHLRTECALCLAKLVKYDWFRQALIANCLDDLYRAMREAHASGRQLYSLSAAIMNVLYCSCYQPQNEKNIEHCKKIGVYGMINDMQMDLRNSDLVFLR